jgi:putative tryptophan/tyrosine transport system substrate-binding protein
MNRREVITLLGGAAAPWPRMARAERADRMRRIGFIQVVGENDPEAQARIRAFQQGLAALDWVENRNIRIIYRFAAAGDAARIQTIVAEIVSLMPDLIVAGGHTHGRGTKRGNIYNSHRFRRRQ